MPRGTRAHRISSRRDTSALTPTMRASPSVRSTSSTRQRRRRSRKLPARAKRAGPCSDLNFLEAGHVRAYAYYARIAKCPLYIQHTTTPETIEEITRAREEGGTVYAQTGGHYLDLTEEAWRINVPLRSRESVEAVWQALADGRIDTVGSDHTNVSRPRSEMEVKGDIFATRTGFPSRGEAHWPVMLNGVSSGRISLQRLVEVCCENTARKTSTRRWRL